MTEKKRIIEILPEDLRSFPVWEFALDLEVVDEQIIRPVKTLPVTSLANRIIGTEVRLANGNIEWAFLGNVDLQSLERTRHFLTLSLYHCNSWFTLARYHDFDYEQHGPAALSAYFRLREEDIFPVVYDIRKYSVGDPLVLVDSIEAVPSQKLSESELLALALP